MADHLANETLSSLAILESFLGPLVDHSRRLV